MATKQKNSKLKIVEKAWYLDEARLQKLLDRTFPGAEMECSVSFNPGDEDYEWEIQLGYMSVCKQKKRNKYVTEIDEGGALDEYDKVDEAIEAVLTAIFTNGLGHFIVEAH